MDELETPIKTIENRDFYELMQRYRHTPIVPVHGPALAYQDVINHVNDLVNPLVVRAVELRNWYVDVANRTNSDDERNNCKEQIAAIDAELEAWPTSTTES
jgi:hypothetical protein